MSVNAFVLGNLTEPFNWSGCAPEVINETKVSLIKRKQDLIFKDLVWEQKYYRNVIFYTDICQVLNYLYFKLISSQADGEPRLVKSHLVSQYTHKFCQNKRIKGTNSPTSSEFQHIFIHAYIFTHAYIFIVASFGYLCIYLLLLMAKITWGQRWDPCAALLNQITLKKKCNEIKPINHNYHAAT